MYKIKKKNKNTNYTQFRLAYHFVWHVYRVISIGLHVYAKREFLTFIYELYNMRTNKTVKVTINFRLHREVP